MIAGVRQFKLINALGREYDMTRPDALLHAPDGLGWGTERTVERLGMTYIGINEKEIHQSPSGEMVFRTYEEYGRFLSFCQQGGLVLCYKPLETWYYCECLISIQKSEIEWENNHLICPVQFTLLSYWYERVVAQTAEPPEPEEPNYSTVTGDPAVFNARYSYPIKELTVDIQGSQDLNGYSKPWVGGAGKNKFQNRGTTRTTNGITYTVNADGTVTANGTATAVSVYELFWTGISGTSYILNGCPSGGSSNKYAMDTYNSNVPLVRDYGSGVTFTRDGNSQRVRIVVFNGVTVENLVFSPMIRLATVADSTYEPYENICPITSYTSVEITQSGSTTNTYTVELTGAGNVYKGTLDVTTGELVVNNVVKVYTTTSGWYKNSSATAFAQFWRRDNDIRGRNPIELLCSHFPFSTTLQVVNTIANHTNNYYNLEVNFEDASMTLADFGTFLATQNENGTPFQVMTDLATPLTYQLTPTQLSNLIGENTIKADAGAVTVTYRTDGRTEYKIYPYQYSYKYGDTAQNVFDISCDLPSYFKLTIFGEATNPSWRVVQNGSIVKSGKLNATIGSSQKLVINTDPKQTEIALYTLSNTVINNLYGYSDFATERIFALPQGESQVQVLTEDEQPPKVMIEVLKHV